MVHGNVTRVFLFGGAVALVFIVLFGFAGRYLPPADAVAVVQPLAAVFLMPFAALLWSMSARPLALVSLVSAIAAIGSVLPGFLLSEMPCSGSCITLYQKNLLSKAWPRYSLADDIIASGAQIVTLQEVSDHNQRFMASLFQHYTVAALCRFRPEQAVAVLTSLPVVKGSQFCTPGVGLAGVRVEMPGGEKTWVLSLHLEWPFPFDQAYQSRVIANRIADLDGPILIGGDFNMVPWGGSVKRIEQAAGSHRLGPFRNTYSLGSWLLPLPIDTVLVPNGAAGMVELRPYMGSDHLGVLARIALP